MAVKLDISQGTVRGYWVQYGDDVKIDPVTRKFDAIPVFIALPPDPEQYPGPYIYELDYKESYSIGTSGSLTTPEAALPDVLTYRDTQDWPISEGSAATIDG